jgi:hypothetical protein
MRDLNGHASRDAVIEYVGNRVDNSRHLAKVRHENGSYLANACKNLEAVVNANNPVIARIRAEIVLLNHVYSTGGYSTTVAASSLNAQA